MKQGEILRSVVCEFCRDNLRLCARAAKRSENEGMEEFPKTKRKSKRKLDSMDELI